MAFWLFGFWLIAVAVGADLVHALEFFVEFFAVAVAVKTEGRVVLEDELLATSEGALLALFDKLEGRLATWEDGADDVVELVHGVGYDSGYIDGVKEGKGGQECSQSLGVGWRFRGLLISLLFPDAWHLLLSGESQNYD